MLTKDPSKLIHMPVELPVTTVMQRLRLADWQLVALASLCAGIGSGWQVLLSRTELISPLTAAITMVLATFAGWYVWGFFTYLTDNVLFGGHSDFRGTLAVFSRAYLFQALFLFTFTRPLGWLWGWIALYLTVAAWGILSPRQLGTRSWQAVLVVTAGMLVWLACLLIGTLTLVWGGAPIGVGAFLA
jgi:hypothetical protein